MTDITARPDALAGKLAREVQELLVAITYADPPKLFNDVLCHEARVPVEFVKNARAALAEWEATRHD